MCAGGWGSAHGQGPGVRPCYWIVWIVTAILGIIYIGCGMATFEAVLTRPASRSEMPMKYGMLASCFLGFVMVLALLLISICVPLTRPAFISITAEIAWGAVSGAMFVMVFFMLLAGLALQSGEPWARREIQSDSELRFQTYRAAYGFAYLLSIWLVVFFFVVMGSNTAYHQGLPIGTMPGFMGGWFGQPTMMGGTMMGGTMMGGTMMGAAPIVHPTMGGAMVPTAAPLGYPPADLRTVPAGMAVQMPVTQAVGMGPPAGYPGRF